MQLSSSPIRLAITHKTLSMNPLIVNTDMHDLSGNFSSKSGLDDNPQFTISTDPYPETRLSGLILGFCYFYIY